MQKSLEFAAEARLRPHILIDRLANINAVLANLNAGKIDGRVILKLD